MDTSDKPSPVLRKQNRVKTIHASLGIEGNMLSEDQVTAVMDEKSVVGSSRDIQEVRNAVKAYNQLHSLKPGSARSFLSAHKLLMQSLASDAGKFRSRSAGIVAGTQMTHLPPKAGSVTPLMNELFDYVKSSKDPVLIASCVFHYEMEFIHPFSDGNGRMGWLWQTLILMKSYPVFEFIPFENTIHETQQNYYHALSRSDKAGHSTPFIEYMLNVIDKALVRMLDVKSQTMSASDRLTYFADKVESSFTRSDYMLLFMDISSATASRDLKLGVDQGLFKKSGDKTKTVYQSKKG